MNTPPLIAFNLPQFHPIPENDEWWGKGFTEWTNVVRARPRYRGHYQPHLPADLGFYDLRLPEARQAQADLARLYGISGFCHYHYWFNGRRLLERPVNDMLKSREPDFPFCLCWANEPWSRNWDGGNRLVLVEQKYSPDDDLAHIRWLIKAFADPRYIRIGGKPLFIVYRASHLPNPTRMLEQWRDEARKQGIGELLLCRVHSHGPDHIDPRPSGFDAAIEFAPDAYCYYPASRGFLRGRRQALRRRLVPVSYRLWRGAEWSMKQVEKAAGFASLRIRASSENLVVSYADFISNMLRKPRPEYELFHCVCPMWDNSARRPVGAMIMDGATPQRYEDWLREVVRRHQLLGRGDRPIFVNAWNEWAEGCHLEPCQKWGRAFLEATARAIGRTPSEDDA